MMNSKLTKRNRNSNTDSCKSSLSDLPDEVLQCILTKLPTKDVVKMSTLSKKFEELCTSVGVLKISQKKFEERSLFIKFVDSRLPLSYHHQTPIKVFHLSCDVLSDASRVYRWISTVIWCNIEVLYLSLQCLSPGYRLPSLLFNSPALITLHLDMPFVLILPSYIDLPSLKILKLGHVVFADGYSTQKLLSSSALEELSIFRCFWSCSTSVHALKLQRLSIDESNSDLHEKDHRNIKIFCTKLRSFYYKGDLRQGTFKIDCSSSLVKVTIDLHDSKFFCCEYSLCERIIKMLRGLTHVRDLSLLGRFIEALEYDDRHLVGCLPMFYNLTKLKLYGGHICFDWGPFLHLLSKFPQLAILELVDVSIERNPDSPIDFDANELILDHVPPCLQSHLKIIIISNDDVPPIGALLKATEALETLIILTRSSAHVEGDIQRLQSIRRDLDIIKLFSGQAVPPAPIPN